MIERFQLAFDTQGSSIRNHLCNRIFVAFHNPCRRRDRRGIGSRLDEKNKAAAKGAIPTMRERFISGSNAQ